MSTNKEAPHQAILHIMIEVHELTPKGECSGITVINHDLEKFKIKPRMLFAITGNNRDECLEKLRQTLEQIHNG